MKVFPICYNQLKYFMKTILKNKAIREESPVLVFAKSEPEIGFVPCTILGTSEIGKVENITPPDSAMLKSDDEAIVIVIDKWPETYVHHVSTESKKHIIEFNQGKGDKL